MTTYYFDYDNGDDANSGLSELLPKKDPSNFTYNISGEKNYLLKRGCTFTSSAGMQFINVSASGNGISQLQRFGAYGNESAPKPKINCTGHQIGISLLGSNILIEDIEIYNVDSGVGLRRLINLGAAGTPISNITIRNCVIHGAVHNAHPNESDGIWGYVNNMNVLDTDIYDIGSDAIWAVGDDISIGRCHMYLVAMSMEDTGDVIQVEGARLHVYDCILDHSDYECKHVIWNNNPSGAIIERNIMLMSSSRSPVPDVSKGINFLSDGPGCIVRQNVIDGGWAGIWSNPIDIQIYSNIITNTYGRGIYLAGANNSTVVCNNTIDANNLTINPFYGIHLLSNSASGFKFCNNVFKNMINPSAYGIVWGGTLTGSDYVCRSNIFKDVWNNVSSAGSGALYTEKSDTSNKYYTDPNLDTSYSPLNNSPCINNGYAWWGDTIIHDRNGRTFDKRYPHIGAIR